MSEKTSNRTHAIAIVLAVVGIVAVAGAFGAAGQLAQDRVQTQDTAYLRVAHASPDAPAVDVYVDNQSEMTDVQFGDVGQYLALDAGNHTVTVRPAGDNQTTVFEGNVTLDARSVSTLYAAGEVSANSSAPFGPVAVSDDAFTPGANDSAIRVVHLSPDAPAVDVTTSTANGTVVLAENVSYANASSYVTVPAGNYTVEVRGATATNDGPVVATVDVSLSGGEAYSAVALGYLDTSTAPAATPFQVSLNRDATMTVHLPGQQIQNGNGGPSGNQTGMADLSG